MGKVWQFYNIMVQFCFPTIAIIRQNQERGHYWVQKYCIKQRNYFSWNWFQRCNYFFPHKLMINIWTGFHQKDCALLGCLYVQFFVSSISLIFFYFFMLTLLLVLGLLADSRCLIISESQACTTRNNFVNNFLASLLHSFCKFQH